MIISKDKQGNWTPTAGGTGTFIGTKATIGFAHITANNTPMVLTFYDRLAGATNGDQRYWYVKAYRIG